MRGGDAVPPNDVTTGTGRARPRRRITDAYSIDAADAGLVAPPARKSADLRRPSVQALRAAGGDPGRHARRPSVQALRAAGGGRGDSSGRLDGVSGGPLIVQSDKTL